MEDKIITFAVHSPKKADILRYVLEKNGINVYLKKVNDGTDGVAVRVKEASLSQALAIIEENNLFSYNDQNTHNMDDGRKRILVAVDFSNYSLHACRVAFNIAKDINAKVKILHVYYKVQFPTSLPFADSLKEDREEGLLDKVRKKMLDLCFEIDKKITEGDFPSINYSYSIREGIVEDEIDNFIKEYKPSLLVIGTKGKHNKENSILGNVTADIIEMTDVPVLAVPETAPKSTSQVKHMAFLTNMHEGDTYSFKKLIDILKLRPDVKITLVHINLNNRKDLTWTENELSRIKDLFNNEFPGLNINYELIDTPDLLSALADFIDKENVGVIALNTRRRNLFGRIFMPSVSRKMLFKFNVGLLILRG